MARRMCDVCGARPATVAIRRLVPGGGQRIEHLCDIHAAQARGGRSSFGGGSLFDDFFNQFFETPGGPRRIPIGEEATGRRAEQVDVTRFFSESTSELLRRAAQRAMEWGGADLTTEHLLHAALEDDMARHVLEWVDADPDDISAQLEEATKGGRTDLSPSLAPDAKRALLAAYEESQALESSYIGPEHAQKPCGRIRPVRPELFEQI
jgi:ATP-dependent Clp protease ATP-binding subunit ClpC